METISKNRIDLLIGGFRALSQGKADEADIYYLLCREIPELFSHAASELMGARILEEAKEGNPNYDALKNMNISAKEFSNDFVTNARIMQIGALINDVKHGKEEPEMIMFHLKRHGIMEEEINYFLNKLK